MNCEWTRCSAGIAGQRANSTEGWRQCVEGFACTSAGRCEEREQIATKRGPERSERMQQGPAGESLNAAPTPTCTQEDTSPEGPGATLIVAPYFGLFPLHYARCHERYFLLIDPLFHFKHFLGHTEAQLVAFQEQKQSMTVAEKDAVFEIDPGVVLKTEDVQRIAVQLKRELAHTAIKCYAKNPILRQSGLDEYNFLQSSISMDGPAPTIEIKFSSRGVPRTLLYVIAEAQHVNLPSLLKGLQVSTLSTVGAGNAAIHAAINATSSCSPRKDFRLVTSALPHWNDALLRACGLALRVEDYSGRFERCNACQYQVQLGIPTERVDGAQVWYLSRFRGKCYRIGQLVPSDTRKTIVYNGHHSVHQLYSTSLAKTVEVEEAKNQRERDTIFERHKQMMEERRQKRGGRSD